MIDDLNAEKLSEGYYLGLDPGKATGWAAFNEKGQLLEIGVCKKKGDLEDLLKKCQPKIIIIENFKLRPWAAREQSWSDMPASKVIGAIELYCNVMEITLVKQEPNCKEIGYKWSGIKKARSHKDSHYRDAYAHVVYYLVKNKITRVSDYIDLEKT